MEEPGVLVVPLHVLSHALKFLVDPDLLQADNVVVSLGEVSGYGRQSRWPVFGDKGKAPGQLVSCAES